MDKEQENRELEVKEESTQTGTEGETGEAFGRQCI